MKNTYAAPTVALSGDVVRETLGGITTGPEVAQKPLSVGSVGFYL
jgi:hypothetical protein